MRPQPWSPRTSLHDSNPTSSSAPEPVLETGSSATPARSGSAAETAAETGFESGVESGTRTGPDSKARLANPSDRIGPEKSRVTVPAEEVRARLAWLLTSGIGPTRCRELADAPGGAAAMLRAPAGEVAARLGAGLATARSWQRSARASDADGELRRTREQGATIVALGEPSYPSLLAAIPDPPPLLWVATQGVSVRDSGSLALPAVAIVGTRRATAYGMETATRFGEGLAGCGFAIVSGGARGIDAAAHRAALRVGGPTLAVFGAGLGRRYPPEHDRLFDEIVAGGGALLSEWPIGTEPRPGHFPRRNRIVSGLAIGVLVVEAAVRSGALITARLAVEEHGREAMAVPGRIDMPQSAGCLRAIRAGWAAPVASLAEIGEQLGEALHLVSGAAERVATDSNSDRGSPPSKKASVNGVDRTIVEIARRHHGDPAAVVDAIVAETGLGAAAVAARLTRLRLAGAIEDR